MATYDLASTFGRLNPPRPGGPAAGYAAWYDLAKNNRVLSGDSIDCTDVPDAGSGANDGVITNAGDGVASWTRDVPDNADASRALILDGVDDYVRVNTGSAIADYPFTLCGWVKREKDGEANSIAILSDASTIVVYIGLQVEATNYISIRYRGAGGNVTEPSTTHKLEIADGWTHLAVVFASATDRRLYKNGVLAKASTVDVGAYDTDADVLLLGTYRVTAPAAGYYFEGRQADMRLYDSELSVDDLLDLVAGTAVSQTPVMQLPRTGGPAAAAVSESVDRILAHEPFEYDLDVVPAGGGPIRTAKGADYNGTSQSIKAMAANWGDALAQPLDIFVTAQCDDATPTAAMRVFDSDDAGNECSMVIGTDGEITIDADTSWATGYSVPDTDAHVYHVHLEGASSKLYVDGQLVASGDAGENDLDGLVLGSNRAQDGDWFDGAIQDAVIYGD